MLLPMPACAAILLFLFVFENQDFIVFSLRFQSAQYRRSLHNRLTDIRFIVGLHQKNVLEFHRSTLLHVEPFNADNVPFRNAVLLSAGLYDCIHGLTSWDEIEDLTKKWGKRQYQIRRKPIKSRLFLALPPQIKPLLSPAFAETEIQAVFPVFIPCGKKRKIFRNIVFDNDDLLLVGSQVPGEGYYHILG